MLAHEAAAAVLIFTPEPAPFTGSYSDEYGIKFDPQGNGTGTLFCDSVNGLGICLSASLSGSFAVMDVDNIREYKLVGSIVDTGSFTYFTADRLTWGDTIGTENTVAVNGAPISPFTDYTADEVFFLGYGFRAQGSSDLYNYGWVELSLNNDAEISVYRWAYEDVSGQTITIIPEPSQIALLLGGLGIAAIAAHKRLRRGKSA